MVSVVRNVCGDVQSRATHKARLPSQTAARQRGTRAEVQKTNEKVSAVIAHTAEEAAKEEEKLPLGKEEGKELPKKMGSKGNRRKVTI